MGRTATRAQDGRARAREARWALLEERNARDARIEEATIAALLALEDRAAAQSNADAAERATATRCNSWPCVTTRWCAVRRLLIEWR